MQGTHRGHGGQLEGVKMTWRRHARTRQKSGKLLPIWGQNTNCTDWDQLLPISCDAFDNYEMKLNPVLFPSASCFKESVAYELNLQSHSPPTLYMQWEPNTSPGTFSGTEVQLLQSWYFCESAQDMAVLLASWGGWEVVDISLPLADVSRRAEVQVSPGFLCLLAVRPPARIMTLRLPSMLFFGCRNPSCLFFF